MEKSQRLQKSIAERDKQMMKSVTDSIEKVNKTLIKTYEKLQETVEYVDVYSSQSIQEDVDIMSELSKATIIQAAEMQFQIQSYLLTYYWDYDSLSIMDRRIGENGAVIYLLQEFVQRCVDMQEVNVTANSTGTSDIPDGLTDISDSILAQFLNSTGSAVEERKTTTATNGKLQTDMTSDMTSQEVTTLSQKASHAMTSSEITSPSMHSPTEVSARTPSSSDITSGTTESFKQSSNISPEMSSSDTSISQPNQMSDNPSDNLSDNPSANPAGSNSMTSKGPGATNYTIPSSTLPLNLTTSQPIPDKEEVDQLLAEHEFFNIGGDVANCDIGYQGFMNKKESSEQLTAWFEKYK